MDSLLSTYSIVSLRLHSPRGLGRCSHCLFISPRSFTVVMLLPPVSDSVVLLIFHYYPLSRSLVPGIALGASLLIYNFYEPRRPLLRL